MKINFISKERIILTMKGYIINPNKEVVSKIIDGIYKKNGHCPCRVKVDETTMCPCDEFVETGKCVCRLYLPIEEK